MKLILQAITTQMILLIYMVRSQTTFYFEDENIRFCTCLSQIDQVTLIPAVNTTINKNQSMMTFNKPTDYIDNVTNTQLILAGFSIQNSMNLQYNSNVRYTQGNFQIQIQAFNETTFNFVSFYVVLYRVQALSYFESRSACLTCKLLSQNANKPRTQMLNVTMSTNKTTVNWVVKVYLKSMRAREGGNGYTRLKVSYSYWDTYQTKLTVIFESLESVVTQACATVVALISTTATSNNYTYFTNDLTVREFAAASIKALPANFGISSTIYGPIFNKKCLIGFTNLYFRDGIKQIFFDSTKTGIQSLTQNTPQYFYAEISSFCVSRQKQCAYNQGVQTGIQECVNCSVMIKNCAFCLTQSQCTQCMTGYFIDSIKKCCPVYLKNCSICSLGNTCTMCAEGFYLNQLGGCVACSLTLPNCLKCQNSTFCYKCPQTYTLTNYTTCTKPQNSTIPSNQTNSTTNSTTDNSSNVTPNQSKSDGLSLWMILFFVGVGVAVLLLALVIVLCVKWKQKEGNDRKGNADDQLGKEKLEKRVVTPMPEKLKSEERQIVGDRGSGGDRGPTEDQFVYEDDIKPGTGMQIRNGTHFQESYMAPVPKPIAKQKIPTKQPSLHTPSKDVSMMTPKQKFNSFHNLDTKQLNTPKTNNQSKFLYNNDSKLPKRDIQSNQSYRNGQQSQRGFIPKDSAFLPEMSKNTLNYGGSIHLRADYYK